ncbi:MAG: hypothetical protein KF892_23585 [Rhizobacter sp.]|nr:hypothetical protein [Rhizobacter sp.]
MAFILQEISAEVEAAIYGPIYAPAIVPHAIVTEEHDRSRRRRCAIDEARDAYFLRLRQSSDPREGTRYLYALLVRGGHFIFEELRYNEYKILALGNIAIGEAKALSIEALLVAGRRMNGNKEDLDEFDPMFF